MRIELNDLLASMAPDPIVLTIGGEEFPLKDFTVAEVLAFNTVADSDALSVEQIASAFADRVPPVLTRMRELLAAGEGASFVEKGNVRKQVTLIDSAIKLAWNEVASPKNLLEAVQTIKDRLTTASNFSPG